MRPCSNKVGAGVNTPNRRGRRRRRWCECIVWRVGPGPVARQKTRSRRTPGQSKTRAAALDKADVKIGKNVQRSASTSIGWDRRRLVRSMRVSHRSNKLGRGRGQSARYDSAVGCKYRLEADRREPQLILTAAYPAGGSNEESSNSDMYENEQQHTMNLE